MIQSTWRFSVGVISHNSLPQFYSRRSKQSFLPQPLFAPSVGRTNANLSNSRAVDGAAAVSVCVDGEDEEADRWMSERDVQFLVGDAFYRTESSVGRDLGVLAAALYKRETGSLRVVDAMCGCGVRAMRYIVHSGAEFLLANDACAKLHSTILQNLQRCCSITSQDITRQSLSSYGCTLNNTEYNQKHIEEAESLSNSYVSKSLTADTLTAESKDWKITHLDANRLLVGRYLADDYFDLVDVDSFGSNSVCLRSALMEVRHGGLLYVTSTDGSSSSGHRPYNALAAYGAFVRPMPYCNEIGLRMLIGGVVRDAAVCNLNVWPVFSNYSYHGPVFRVMLRVRQGKLIKNMHYAFIGYCSSCGSSKIVQWEDLGDVNCGCSQQSVSTSLTMAGPLWTGPLHSVDDLQKMSDLARDWGWIGSIGVGASDQFRLMTETSDQTAKAVNLDHLLEVMIEESQPSLPPGFIELPEIAKRGRIQTPKRDVLIKLLQKDGHTASRSHVEPNALKTNCAFFRCLELARTLVC